MTDNTMTIGERYSSATDSSNLRVTSETRGDADLLIAAGWLGERLGATLFRLAHEFDGVRGEHGIAKAEFERVERTACELEAQAAQLLGPSKPPLLAQADEMRQMAAAQALSSRAMMLINLKSLRAAKYALAAFAVEVAGKQPRFADLNPETVIAVSGRALDHFLDGTCHHCQGRGRNGGYGTPTITCRPCAGSGKRRLADMSHTPAARELGTLLIDQMDRMLRQAGAGIRSFTRNEG